MKVTYTETEQSVRITVTDLTVGELLEYFTDTLKNPQRGGDGEVWRERWTRKEYGERE